MDTYFKIKLSTTLKDNRHINVREKHDDDKIIITCGNNVLILKPTECPRRHTWPPTEDLVCPVVYCPSSKLFVAVKNTMVLELHSQSGEVVQSLILPQPVHCLLSSEDPQAEPLVVWARGAVQPLSAVLKKQPLPRGCLEPEETQIMAVTHHLTAVYLVVLHGQTSLRLHQLEVGQPEATSSQPLEVPRDGEQLVATCHLPACGLLLLWSSGHLTTPSRFLGNLGGPCLHMVALGHHALALLKHHDQELKVEVWDVRATVQTQSLSLPNQDGSHLSYIKGHLIVAGEKGIHHVPLAPPGPPRISTLVGSRKRKLRSESPSRHKRKHKSNHHHSGDEDEDQLLKLGSDALQQFSEDRTCQLILDCLRRDGTLFPLPPPNGVPLRPELAKPLFFKRLLSAVNLDPNVVCLRASPHDLTVLMECLCECLRLAERSDHHQVYNLVVWTQTALRRSLHFHNQLPLERLHTLLSTVETFLNHYEMSDQMPSAAAD